MATGNSAKQQWASLNKHFVSFLIKHFYLSIFIANTCSYIGR